MADQVSEVKAKTDIVSVVGEHVRLQKAGSNYKGLCPFHSEKTPSFMVSGELQIYKCFGCGESGDVISFLEKYEGMEFYEALKILAERAGVELKPVKSEGFSQRQKLLEINAQAARLYHYILTKHKKGKKALDYVLKGRGLTSESIETFGIGFAPETGNPMLTFLTKKKGFSEEDIVAAGVAGRGKYGIYERFSGRIIFPLYDHRGNVVALAGRVLPGADSDRAKYINSPETAVYKKSQTLYGLNITRGEVKRSGMVVVVEGELDMISSWQAGIKNVVAIKGTALTKEQVVIISRLAREVVFALDADIAGDAAARRGISIALEAGLDVKVATMGKYKDPDDFARSDPAGYAKALSENLDIWEFFIKSIAQNFDLDTGTGKAGYSRKIIPILASIPDRIVQAHYVGRVAQLLRVPEEAVTAQLARAKMVKPKAPDVAIAPAKRDRQKTRLELLEEELLVLILQSGVSMVDTKALFPYLNSPFPKKLLKHVDSLIREKGTLSNKLLAELLPKELWEGFAKLAMVEADIPQDDEAFYKRAGRVMHEIDKIKNDTQKQLLSQEIKDLQEEGKKDKEISEKLVELSKLTKEIPPLEKDEIMSIILK